MPQRLTLKSKSESTPLRRSPRLQQLNPQNPNLRYPEILLHSPSIKTSTARFSPNEFPIVCALKPLEGSNDCGKLRDGLREDCGLRNGVVRNRWFSRNLGRIGEVDRGSEEGKSGFETPLIDRRGEVNRKSKGLRLRSRGVGIEGLRRSARILKKCSSSMELVGEACNGDADKDVNGGLGKRLTRSSVAGLKVELDEKRGVNVSGMKMIYMEGCESGQRGIGESGMSLCGDVSGGVMSEMSKAIPKRRTGSKSEVNGVVEIQGLRQSPRLLDRRNAQKAVTIAHDTKAIQSTICGSKSKRVVQKEKEGIQSRRKRRRTVTDLAIEPAEGEAKICGTKEKQGGNEACYVYEDACATPVPGKMTVQVKAYGLRVTGRKRERKQVYRVDQGWSGEQLSALQRAYFATKPTPHFWKKVAKMVPGKSAQNCFDRVNSEKSTPSLRPPHPRLKPRIPSLSPGFSCSPCKLFRFKEPKNKRVRTIKHKSRIAQKTARHLLQKFSQVCRNGEADLFSLLEPNVNLVNEVVQHSPSHATPIRRIQNLGSSPVLVQSLSASHKKPLSRFCGANEAPLVSPPVLKPIKNLALHEKYIDHLHNREAKRTAASTRNVKLSTIKHQTQGSLRNGNIVQTAKSALVSDARDAISRFQHLQANLIEDLLESEENLDDAGETISGESSLFSPLRNYRL